MFFKTHLLFLQELTEDMTYYLIFISSASNQILNMIILMPNKFHRKKYENNIHMLHYSCFLTLTSWHSAEKIQKSEGNVQCSFQKLLVVI